ncbi:hypothetical protein EBS02_01960 [bacterium]|nr:hypothetical protein [bacterium]
MTYSINKGVELLLRSKKKPQCPKIFNFGFGKTVSLLKREISVSFYFSFDIKKQFLSESKNDRCNNNNF